MSSNAGKSSSGSSRPLAFDPSLLQPIVRPKRTPMACLECRRRQVKCSGTTPRCERCKKKGIECAYMSLSEQRATGGSISRSGTPQAAHGASSSAQAPQQQSSRTHAGYDAQWAQGMQGFPTGGAYPAPQGWREPTHAQGGSAGGQYAQQGSHSAQGFANLPMEFQQDFLQQQAAAYAHSQGGGGGLPTGGDLYAQGFGAAAQQQAYAGGTTYNAYGQPLPGADPRYAFQAAQMGGMVLGDQQTAVYGGHYAQQMYFDQTAAGQMMSNDAAAAAAAQQWAGNSQAYQTHGFPGQ
ncbi:hypothetical protein C8Q77DRAFT_386262 [Trametes polyzona]|nr:hypothetical protein C8Q77DRAFT_386262 [Trametes polyzona]